MKQVLCDDLFEHVVQPLALFVQHEGVGIPAWQREGGRAAVGE